MSVGQMPGHDKVYANEQNAQIVKKKIYIYITIS